MSDEAALLRAEIAALKEACEERDRRWVAAYSELEVLAKYWRMETVGDPSNSRSVENPLDSTNSITFIFIFDYNNFIYCQNRNFNLTSPRARLL